MLQDDLFNIVKLFYAIIKTSIFIEKFTSPYIEGETLTFKLCINVEFLPSWKPTTWITTTIRRKTTRNNNARKEIRTRENI